LCKLGQNWGVGFDPGLEPTLERVGTDDRVRFVAGAYSAQCADDPPDFICCRQTLEHVDQPTEFVQTLRRIIGHRLNTVVFFEVPNVVFTLRELGIWDIIYEHYSYFSRKSLVRVFTEADFIVGSVKDTFGGQFLCVVALPGNGRQGGVEDSDDMSISHDVTAFGERYREKVALWRRYVERTVGAGQRAVVWGAGSKGISFLNTLEIRDGIRYVVDVNPRKWGCYVVGTGQEIVAPKFLREYKPDVVIVMDAGYKDEIQGLTRDLGERCECICA